MPAAQGPADALHVAFLGCGFITGVHAGHLRRLPSAFRCSFASRDGRRAQEYLRRYGGVRAFDGYDAALQDPSVDAVVVAVPPLLHRDLAVAALRAGKHVLVEKPAFPSTGDYDVVRAERDRAGLVVCVGENDHYKPLAVTLRGLLAEGVIGDLVLARFSTVARLPKPADDWRNDAALAGGDAFFEEGIHWLHLANSLGPRISRISAFRPAAAEGPLEGDSRAKSLLVAFEYDTGGVGSLYYSREVPAPLRGISWSKLYGRRGVITFESNGAVVASPGRRLPRVVAPGLRDIRGYRAMYLDFARAIREGSQPEMGLEQARTDHALMERIAPR
jgi:predicted dehydrogenase